jgi:hypothetical protein
LRLTERGPSRGGRWWWALLTLSASRCILILYLLLTYADVLTVFTAADADGESVNFIPDTFNFAIILYVIC